MGEGNKRWGGGVVAGYESVQTCWVELVGRIFCSYTDNGEIEVSKLVVG